MPVNGTCTGSTQGFQPISLAWNSSSTADAAMNNCSAQPLTGTYSYNIPAEMVIGTNAVQKTFVEPIAQIPSGDPRYDTLPPTTDTTSDFAAVAQSLYQSDDIAQFFNRTGKPSDSFQVTIPPMSKAHLTIHLLLQYRYGTSTVVRGNQTSQWLWMYIYGFSYDTTNYPNNTYIQQTDQVATC